MNIKALFPVALGALLMLSAARVVGAAQAHTASRRPEHHTADGRPSEPLAQRQATVEYGQARRRFLRLQWLQRHHHCKMGG
jgi:hypothetical protein